MGTIGKALEASPLDSIADKIKSTTKDSNLMFEAAEKLVLEAIEKEDDMPIIWEPTLIEDLHNVDFADVACGLDHSLILCCDGTLLSGGSNVYGQLGREKSDLGLHPVDIQLRPVSIAAGLGHSLAICEHISSEATKQEPSVVTWGWNQNSQLGREGPENVPMVVESLDGEKSISVAGGRVHSIAVTAKQEVWSWGCGRNGRLGLGSSADEFEPMLVENLEGFRVLGAVAGFDHNLVLVAE